MEGLVAGIVLGLIFAAVSKPSRRGRAAQPKNPPPPPQASDELPQPPRRAS